MPELDLALADLGRRLEFPATPDVAARVSARIAAQAPTRRAAPRRLLVIALATLVVAVSAAFAVPQTRAAILEFFHLRGVTIERVEELPTVPANSGLGLFLGERVTLDQARERAAFDPVVPTALGDPDAIYFQTSPPGGMVSFVYGSKEHPRALFTQFAATVDEVVFKKVAPETTIDPVTIGGEPGYWLQGAHFFAYFDRSGAMQSEQVRLAGSTLLWERGPLTLRLEADISKAAALAIARSAN